MFFLDVAFSLATLAKGTITLRAGKWKLPCMRSFVHDEARSSCETVATLFTYEWFLSRMKTHMLLEFIFELFYLIIENPYF